VSRITINSNQPALNTQRRLAESTNSLQASFERLSSGLRINRAKDDAAGLAIASGLKVDNRVFLQGVRNLNDGVSYLNVAEGAGRELSSILIRLKELAQQSANGVFSNAQRAPLQGEATALQEEYNRIIESTSFNNRTLFQAQHSTLVVQAGYGQQGSIRIELVPGADSAALPYGEEIARVSVDSVGTQGNGDSSTFSPASLSADGRFVVFQSDATNLVAGDTNAASDIFVHDRLTGQTTRVSVDSSGTQASGGSSFDPAISADGRYVVFESSATNLVAGDTNARSDIFVHDRLTSQTTRVSVDSSGTQANGESDLGSVSADGRYVAFYSSASNLVAGDTNAALDVFVHDRQTGQTTRVSVDSSGIQATGGDSDDPTISADGRYVTFESDATNLVAGDTNAATDVFVHDRQTGQTTRVSVDSSSTQGNDRSFDAAISADGRYVAFESDATNLVAGDTNAAKDLFLRDLHTGQTIRISVNSSGTQGNGSNDGAAISADGRYVTFYSSASNLVNGDTNGVKDVFVAPNPFASATESSGSFVLTLLAGMDVTTQSAALATLDAIDPYFTELQSLTGAVGSAQSRFQAAHATLQATSDNLRSAESRIVDADIADESARLVKGQILQQAGAAVLAQANRMPALALLLLQG
jgi:flagellin-like hook-associated protein FlgL